MYCIGPDVHLENHQLQPSKDGIANGQEAALASDIPQLPNRFQGRISNAYANSEPDVISLPTALAGAANVLVILLDDVGFRRPVHSAGRFTF